MCACVQDYKKFLLGTGRMPHPVGGAMGMTLCTAAGICMAVVLRPRLLTSAFLARHPANCSKALPEVFRSDLPVCQCIRTLMLM